MDPRFRFRVKREKILSLFTIFEKHTGPVINKWAHYFPIYENHFSRFRGVPTLMFEIGAGHGGSGQLWRSYFGPTVQIVSIDIREECKDLESEQIAVRIGSQADAAFLQSIVDEFGRPDIVLDDGSHVMEHVCETFKYLYPQMARGGVYLVEDLHTAYWEEYGGGLRKEGSFIELIKVLIDEMHSHYSRDGIAPTIYSENTRAIHVYDSIISLDHGKFQQRGQVSRPTGSDVLY